ncbi:MAG: DUF427 domain-containing protein [Phototrophicaceae bacterium]
MAKAVLNGIVLAESDHVQEVEGNLYFPPDSVNMAYFSTTDRHTTCPWKGVASYYSVNADGRSLPNIAWYYPNPSNAAKHIKDHVAFYSQITVTR